MKILEHKFWEYNGSALLSLRVDKEPDWVKADRVYTKRESIVRCQQGDMVYFNSICDLADGGYGRQSFSFNLDDGTKLENVGAWSSRPSVVNMLFPECDCCMNVGMTDGPKVGGGVATNMTIKSLVDYLDSVNDPMPLWRVVESSGEICFYFKSFPSYIEQAYARITRIRG